MRLTRRGYGAVVVVVLALVVGWQFGARSLNAIAAPTLAALLGSALVVATSGRPTVESSPVDAGFPGETRTFDLSVSGNGLARVDLALPEGIDGSADDGPLTLPETIEWELELDRRGTYDLGPATVRQHGPLGLVERHVETTELTDVAVFPHLYSVSQQAILSRFFLDELEAERQEFERLREYEPGDPLRHVHWKSSAKHDEFLVMEFAPSLRSETVTIVGTATGTGADEMARLAATIADVVLDAGFNVELAVPGGHLPPGQGTAHRENILWLLARTGGGTAPLDGGDADVEIRADDDSATVRITDSEYARVDLLGPNAASRPANGEGDSENETGAGGGTHGSPADRETGQTKSDRDVAGTEVSP